MASLFKLLYSNFTSMLNTSNIMHTAAGDVEIVYDPSDVHENNFAVSCVYQLKDYGDGVKYRIAVDDTFMKAPSHIKNAFIYHEIGHIVCGHLANSDNLSASKRLALAIGGAVSEKELEADRYAASYLGKNIMIDALKWMRNSGTVTYLGRRELRIRIKALK